MKYSYLYLSLCIMICGFTACKKTIDYEPLQQNRITEYKVINLQDTVIYGAVDNIQNTVTVYVPYYYGMSVIQPKITLDAGATLSTPALPVDVSNNSQTYTVKGADGSTRTYKLSIVQQNTPNLVLHWADDSPTSNPFQPLADLYGNFLSTGTATLKVELVNQKTNQSTMADVSGAGMIVNYSPVPGAYSLAGVNIPLNADSGYYNVNVSYLGHTVAMDKPLHIIYNVPQVQQIFDVLTVARGGTLSFLPIGNPYPFINLESVSVTIQGTAYNLPIQTNTRSKAILTIPANVPTGDWGTVNFSFQFGNWPPDLVPAHLVITP